MLTKAIWMGKRLKEEFSEDDISGGAAELAYRFFLALFPFLIFLAALGGFLASAVNVTNPTEEIMNRLQGSLPEDAASVLRTQIDTVVNNRDAGLLSLSIIGAIWAASSGITSLMKTTNRIYEVAESRPIWRRYLLAVGLTIFGAGLLVLSFTVFFFGQLYSERLANEVGLDEAASVALTIFQYVFPVLGVLLAVALLYWLAPDADLPFRWLSPGALFFSIAWFVASFLFSLYVSNFGSYNATYGALGGVVILLIWFYLTSFLLLLGAEINMILAEAFEPDVLESQDNILEDEKPSQRERPDSYGADNQEQLRTGESSTAPASRAEGAAPSHRAGGNMSSMASRPVAVGLTGLVWAIALFSVVRSGLRPSRD